MGIFHYFTDILYTEQLIDLLKKLTLQPNYVSNYFSLSVLYECLTVLFLGYGSVGEVCCSILQMYKLSYLRE